MTEILHNTPYPIKVSTAYNNGTTMTAITSSNINSTAVVNSFRVGVIVMTTDTFNLYKHNGAAFQPIQILNMAVTSMGQVVTSKGRIVYTY